MSSQRRCTNGGCQNFHQFSKVSQNLDILIEIPEADITAIPVFRPESFPTGRDRDIPVSVQELVYGGKAAGVQTSAKSLDKHNELLSSSEEVHGPRKDRRTSERLETHVLQGKGPKDKILVEKPKHVIRGPEEEVGPRKWQQPSGSSSTLHKQKNMPQKVPKKDMQTPRAIRRESKRKNPIETSLTHRTTEFPRKRIQPWTMCSIWQEL
ncbi:hypothetical protein O181_123540 [Austropuccinia psidii MF-1]|uniref:Uncharacterized protein n=1 Tax=Austropuccinia psidii MF-1 TaxID=1389203 RepID=A0A9Q3KRC8_9BASI|nr:hypothetical protein [Austropuccinia psidii MF-1]